MISPFSTHILIRSSFSLNFNDCIHYFRQSINEFLSMLDWTRLPNMLECILPHDHCPFLPTVFSRRPTSSWQSWLQGGYPFSSWSWFKTRLKTGHFYPWILATTRIYLHSIFFHERDHHFAMEFEVIVHDEKLQTIVFTARKNLSLKTCNIMGQSMFSCSYNWIWTLTVTKLFCKLVKSKDFTKSLNYGDFAQNW